MSSNTPTDHDPASALAIADVGTVHCSPDGVITVAVGYVSLRLESPAFRELHALLDSAKQRLDRERPAVTTARAIPAAGLH